MATGSATKTASPETLEEPETLDEGAEPSRGGRPRDEAREQAILDAAIDLVSEIGYDAMSIEAVAARAKSSKATIYRRWPGKAELIAEAMRRRTEPHMVEPEDTGSLRGDLLAMIGRMFESFNGIDGGLMCGLAVAVRNDADLGRLMSSHMHEEKERLVSLVVSRAQARGELSDDVDASLILQVAPGVALLHQMNGEPLDADCAKDLVDRILIPLLRS